MYWSNDAGRNDFHFVDQWGPEHEADLAISYLRNEQQQREAGQPFGLVVSMNPPHHPYDQVPDRYLDMYRDKDPRSLSNRDNVDFDAEEGQAAHARQHLAQYFAMITGVDEQVGRILDELEEQGLADDTIVLFTSDHGSCVGSHGHGFKSVWYEESFKVPFLLRWPGQIKARHDRELILSVPDIYPSLLGLLDMKDAIPDSVVGRNVSGQLRDGSGVYPRNALYQLMSIRNIENSRRGVYTGDYTLVFNPEGKETVILHDNVHDPYQMQNIAGEQPELVAKLCREELLPLLQELDDPWLATTQDSGVLPL